MDSLYVVFHDGEPKSKPLTSLRGARSSLAQYKSKEIYVRDKNNNFVRDENGRVLMRPYYNPDLFEIVEYRPVGVI